jgi:hypothetical protein
MYQGAGMANSTRDGSIVFTKRLSKAQCPLIPLQWTWMHIFLPFVMSVTLFLSCCLWRSNYSCQQLLQCVLMVSDSLTGYTLFRRSSPVFLQLAAQFPELWSNNSAIFISAAVQSRNYQIGYFVLHDTLIALALGTPPLINYDTTSCWVDDGRNSLLEVVYRLPADVIVLIAKINSWRVLRSMDQVTSNQSEWHDLEEHLKHWNPTVDRDDESFDAIARLAVQEVFRQALLIYLYMVCHGSCRLVFFLTYDLPSGYV